MEPNPYKSPDEAKSQDDANKRERHALSQILGWGILISLAVIFGVIILVVVRGILGLKIPAPMMTIC